MGTDVAAADLAGEFIYLNTDWVENTDPLIGFTGSTGAAFDKLQFITNTCGYEKRKAEIQARLDEVNAINAELEAAIEHIKALVETSAAGLTERQASSSEQKMSI